MKTARFALWFLLSAGLYLLARWPFMHASIIPFYLEFRPAIVLVPLAGICWGPVGAFGVMAGSLAGDRLFGFWDALTGFRAIGQLLFAFSAKRLWDFSVGEHFPGLRVAPGLRRALRFQLVALPGCFLYATWPAWGSDMLMIYPFSYFLSLLLLNNVIFCVLLGPALYQFAARHALPKMGSWHDVVEARAGVCQLSFGGAACHITGCVGGCVAGYLVSGSVHQMWPTRTIIHGITSGTTLTLAVLPFLALQVAGLFFARRVPAPAAEDTL
jgi:hypothetical protein